MIKPERNYIAYQSRNPISIFSQELLCACRNYRNYGFSDSMLDCSDSIPLKFDDFLSFVIFEVIAKDFKSKATTRSLRQNIKLDAERNGTTIDEADILNKEKFYSSKLSIFLKAREAEMARLKIPDNPAYKLSSAGMKDRDNLKEGYELSRIQFLQLVDENDLKIKKVHELRRIANSHHSDAIDAAKNFYSDMEKVCVKRSEISDIEDRITYAINLDDFENKNLVDICYRIAEYCNNYNIRNITKDMEKSLISITGQLSFGANKKPVLLIKNLIPAALQEADDSNAKFQIDRYKELQAFRLWLCNNPLPWGTLFTTYKFSLEDFWEFIYYDYNIFNLYQGIPWDGGKHLFPIWCRVVKSLTLDPYSTEF